MATTRSRLVLDVNLRERDVAVDDGQARVAEKLLKTEHVAPGAPVLCPDNPAHAPPRSDEPQVHRARRTSVDLAQDPQGIGP